MIATVLLAISLVTGWGQTTTPPAVQTATVTPTAASVCPTGVIDPDLLDPQYRIRCEKCWPATPEPTGTPWLSTPTPGGPCYCKTQAAMSTEIPQVVQQLQEGIYEGPSGGEIVVNVDDPGCGFGCSGDSPYCDVCPCDPFFCVQDDTGSTPEAPTPTPAAADYYWVHGTDYSRSGAGESKTVTFPSCGGSDVAVGTYIEEKIYSSNGENFRWGPDDVNWYTLRRPIGGKSLFSWNYFNPGAPGCTTESCTMAYFMSVPSWEGMKNGLAWCTSYTCVSALEYFQLGGSIALSKSIYWNVDGMPGGNYVGTYGLHTLCYGTSEPGSAPTPTPDPELLGCNQVQWRDTNPVVGFDGAPGIWTDKGCYTLLPSFSVSVPQIGPIGGQTLAWDGFQLCVRAIQFPVVQLLGWTVPLEVVLLPVAVFVIGLALRL